MAMSGLYYVNVCPLRDSPDTMELLHLGRGRLETGFGVPKTHESFVHMGQYYHDGNLVPTCVPILSVKTVLLSP